MDGGPVIPRRVSLPFLLLAVLSSPGEAHAAEFPTEPSPAVVQPAPPPLPAEPDRWLPLRIFDWRNGIIPFAAVVRLAPDGYLWAGTPNGLNVYDGHTWRKVPIPLLDPPSTHVRSLFIESDGTLWLGTMRDGAFRLKSGHWTQFDQRAGLPEGQITVLAETTDRVRRVVWIGTLNGLARCRDTSCYIVPATRGLSVRTALVTQTEDGRPALWLGTNRGLMRLDDVLGPKPTFASLLFDHRNTLPDDSVRSLVESAPRGHDHELWVATDKGLAHFRRGVWTRYDKAAGFPGKTVTLLSTRWEGRTVLWVGSFGEGLIRIEEDGRWRVFDIRAGLPSNHVADLLATGPDPDNPALWVATTGGLARLERGRWHFFGLRSGLPEESVVGLGEAVFPDGVATHWVSTINSTYRLTPRGWEEYMAFPGVTFSIANTRENGENIFWLSTPEGTLRLHGRHRQLFTSKNSPLPEGWIYLQPDPDVPDGDLWASNRQGLARWAKGHWTAYQPGADGLPGKKLTATTWSHSGQGEAVFWAGTDAGLAEYSAGHWKTIEISCRPHPSIAAVRAATDARGNGWLWIGTPGGLARLRLEKGQPITGTCQSLTDRTAPALPDPRIFDFQFDRQGRVYLCGDDSVTRLTFPPGDTSLKQSRLEVFDSEDGLPGELVYSYGDPLGRIWIGAENGLAVLDPGFEPLAHKPTPPAPIRITRISVRDQALPAGAAISLNHREGPLEIEYALLRFQREHAIRFQTQLVGLQEKASPWTREAHVAYDRLPSGSYTFRVWGRDGEGVVSGPAELGFAVLPPPWLTPWAFALYALALIGLVYGAIRLRVRALARRAAQLEALVAERTRDLAEANRRLELASFTDPLTGLNNRRFLTTTIRPDVIQAIRNHREPLGDPHHRDLVVYLLDLDHFKRLNDRLGHDAGDAVLVETARRLRRVARTSDLVVRWGGEEILVVSRWTDREAGGLLAERLLEAVGGEPFRTGADRTSTVTCSIGWAPFPWSAEDPDAVLFEEVLSLADHALYLAKREGRNRAVGVFPGTAGAEEVAERILREDAPLHSLEGLQVELVGTPGPSVAADDRTTTIRSA
jgi:diguanylate cyclase (GGDEF)-like protein